MKKKEQKDINHYTVNYLFDLDLKYVLLVKKNRTDFKGQLNGCGGTIEFGESGMESALREIAEETGLKPADLRKVGDDELIWLGNLILPYDCKEHHGLCGLHMYAGIVEPASRNKIQHNTDSGEPLVWEPVKDILSSTLENGRYAGEGDLQYFIGQAVKKLEAVAAKTK